MMNTLLNKATIQKTLRFFFAYVLFALFAILGLEIIINLHSAIFRISLLATTRYGLSNFLYVWGSFFLFAIYMVAIVPLEMAMNKAAKTGSILPVGVRIFSIELALALLTMILPAIAEWFLPPV